MGPTKLLPLFTNTTATTLTAWLWAHTSQLLPQQVAQGWQYFDQGEIIAALGCFEDILRQAKAIGDDRFAHIASNSLQFIEQALSRLELDLAAAGAPQVGVPKPVERHYSTAAAFLRNEDPAAALTQLDQALHQFTIQGDMAGVGQTLSAIAQVHFTTADYGRALTYGQAAIAVLEDSNVPHHLAKARHTLGLAHLRLGHLDVAQTHLEKVATLYHQSVDILSEGQTLSTLGQVYAQQKAFMFALAAYEAALDCCLEQTAPATQALTAEVLDYTGELYEAMGHDEFAIAPYRDALATYQRIGDIVKAHRLLHRLGQLYETQGRYTIALDCYSQIAARS